MYILQGTKNLIAYWHTLGKPCDRDALASATKIPKINFISSGRDSASENFQYGETEAQNLAMVLGVQVSDVTTNGGQIQI